MEVTAVSKSYEKTESQEGTNGRSLERPLYFEL